MLTTTIRSLRRAPGLAIAAVLCLSLGAAATTAVSTLVGALLIRPLPFPDADRLVRVWFDEPDVATRVSLSIPDIDDFAQVQAFDRFVGTARVRAVALFGSGAERLRGEAVSPQLLRAAGTAAVRRPAARRRRSASRRATGDGVESRRMGPVLRQRSASDRP